MEVPVADIVVPAVTVASLKPPPESVKCEPACEASSEDVSIEPPESTRVLLPLITMLFIESAVALCVTVAPLAI